MKYPKVINYYLSIISSWELISLLMGQSSRQTCKQKRDDTVLHTNIVYFQKKKLMFIPSPTEEIYTSPLPSSVEIPNFASYTAF